jgi:uncharacterized repeat protein (TIGR02543 family)
MKSFLRNLYIAAAGLALGATAATAAPWPPAKGDLILGVRATAGTGATTNVFYNLGPATTLRDTPNPASPLLVNLDAELKASFGNDWATRSDLYFGVIANKSQNPPLPALGGEGPVNGDPARTIYTTKGTGVANSSIAWSDFSVSALGIAANDHAGLFLAFSGVTANGNNVLTLTQGANPVQWNNSWSVYNPVPGGAFSIFSGGIQRQFAATPGVSQVKMLDLYRVPSDTGDGVYVSTIFLADNGNLFVGNSFETLTVTPPTNGTVTGAGTFPTGSTAQLTATPAVGYAFTGWTGNASGTVNPLNVTMDVDKTIAATFALLPSITTPTFTTVTNTAATLGANVTSLGDGTIVERGVVFSAEGTNADPIIGGPSVTKLTSAGSTGVFTANATSLTAATTYAFKGFVTTSVGTVYTNVAFFTTDTTVPFTLGVGTINGRAIRGGDSQLFKFTLAEASPVVFGGTGMTTEIAWELLDSTNAVIASGTGDIDFEDVLVAGDYSLRVTNNGTPTETFSLNLDASNVAEAKPDVSVGSAATAPVGIDVYSPAAQSVSITSVKANAVSGFFAVDNDGPLDDTFKVQASAGNSLFAVSYFQGADNVTAQVIAGTFTTASLADSDSAVVFRAAVTPNKKSIIKKQKGKKPKTLKKTYASIIKATASSDASLTDTATIVVRTQ